MSCKNVCHLCDNFIISNSVTFTGGNLVIDLPAGSYANNRKVCIVVAQSIPDATTINAPVYITIGGGAVLYPLVKRNCRQVTACGLRTRTRYSTIVETTNNSGLFRMLGNPCCSPDNRLTAINGDSTPVMQSATVKGAK
ncbi:MAG: hypothetical protein KH381_08010 [Clostridium sp.]|nr:hypothetical protein [Clostridium sp.]